MSNADRSPSWEEENVPAASSPASNLLSLQIGVVIVAALYVAREVLVPITVAVLLSFVLSPLVNFFRRLRLGRIPSVLVAVLLAIGVIGTIGTAIGSQVAQLTRHAPEYAATIEKNAANAREFALDKMSGVLEHLGLRQQVWAKLGCAAVGA
ncbi:AI-2E family transporter [Bradyrhizobium ottawaense]|uniref:AI-2E family transporter n=1 Tax=Bradyrhizobium ottawaense TaxID=931866 RepID=UPI003FA0A633